MWVLAAASSSLSEARTDADRHSAGGATAAAEHLLALSCLAAFGRGPATSDRAVADARTVWAAANVQLHSLTVDTDTTVHTLFGNQMGARKDITRRTKGRRATSRF